MSLFVDTSALLALIDRDDGEHARARTALQSAVGAAEPLVTTNYVMVEATALIQRRLGLPAVKDLRARFLPILNVKWVSRDQHDRAITMVLIENRRSLSLVDCSSFVAIEDFGIERVFAFDKHFTQQGFEVIP